MTRFLIKNGYGNTIRHLTHIVSYASTARGLTDERGPFAVWTYDTDTGAQAYDGTRTRRLSDAIVAARKVQS